MATSNIDVTITTVVTIIAAFASLIQCILLFKKLSSNFRKNLKDDLAILACLNENQESHKHLKKYIDEMIKSSYREPYKFDIYHKWEFLIGLILTAASLAFINVTYNGTLLTLIPTILYCFLGPSLIISSFLRQSIYIIYNPR